MDNIDCIHARQINPRPQISDTPTIRKLSVVGLREIS
jgi:hypothetical protein